MKPLLLVLVSAIVTIAATDTVSADRFSLTNGGQVRGELLNPDESPRKSYLIRSSTGGLLKLNRAQVKSVDFLSAEEKRYEEILPRCPDTAEGHWTMAQWCKARRLHQQRKAHLERVIHHDPDHKAARIALGYSEFGDRWMTKEQWMTEQGYVRHEGRWRLPQEIEILERDRKVELGVKGWRKDLTMWRGWLGTKRHDQGRKQIQGIGDPLAAYAVGELLATENNKDVKAWLIDVLGRLDHGAASSALIRCALEDGSERIRELCLDQLEANHDRSAVNAFIAALGSGNVKRIRRAAVGLERMGSVAAIRPLIEVLNTTHKIVTKAASPGSIGVGFGTGGNGGGGLNVGGKEESVLKTIRHKEVQSALISMVGGKVDYGYDEHDWLAWYERKHTPKNVDLRRDF